MNDDVAYPQQLLFRGSSIDDNSLIAGGLVLLAATYLFRQVEVM